MEKQFDAESKELIVLTETGAGAGKGWKEKLWTASVNILASVDPSAGVLNKETTVLEWPLTDGISAFSEPLQRSPDAQGILAAADRSA